jgi:hypothetical protein
VGDGESEVGPAFIHSVGFEQVYPEGIVSPLKLTDCFQEFNWSNAPHLPRHDRRPLVYELPRFHDDDIPEGTILWAGFLQEMYDGIIAAVS